MTAINNDRANVQELKVDGKPSVFVRVVDSIDNEPAAQAPTPERTADPYPMTGYGSLYNPDKETPETLNLSADGMTNLLDDGSSKMKTRFYLLEQQLNHIVNTIGPLDRRETWDAVAKDKELSAAVSTAISKARTAANVARMNAAAVLQETSGSAMAIDRDDEKEAAALAPLFSLKIDKGSLSDIRAEFRKAMRADDVPSLFLFATLLPDRLRAESRGGKNDDSGRRDVDGDKLLVGELNGMVQTVKERFADESLKELRDHAGKIQAQASRLEKLANTQRNAVELKPFQTAQDVRRDGF